MRRRLAFTAVFQRLSFVSFRLFLFQTTGATPVWSPSVGISAGLCRARGVVEQAGLAGLISIKHGTNDPRRQIDPDAARPMKEPHPRTQPFRHVVDRASPRASGAPFQLDVDVADVL